MKISRTVHINGREIETADLRRVMRWDGSETDEAFSERIRAFIKLAGVGFAFTRIPDDDEEAA